MKEKSRKLARPFGLIMDSSEVSLTLDGLDFDDENLVNPENREQDSMGFLKASIREDSHRRKRRNATKNSSSNPTKQRKVIAKSPSGRSKSKTLEAAPVPRQAKPRKKATRRRKRSQQIYKV